METETQCPQTKIRYGAVVRDVLIVWLLTSIGGFVVGLAVGTTQSPRFMLAVAASNILLGTVAFIIVGCLAGEGRWKHLAVVALLVWLIGVVNLAFGVTLVQWFFGFIPLAVVMGLGGGIAHLIRRKGNAQPPSGPPPVGGKDVPPAE